MMLGIFTDDYFPYIGGMGRYLHEVTRRLPQHKFAVFSPCVNQLPGHTQVTPFLHDHLRNVSYSIWLQRNLDRFIDRCNLDRINIQCGPGGLFLFNRAKLPVIAICYHTWWQQSHYIRAQFWKKIFIPFEILTYRRSDRIICISEDSRNILVDKYRINASKTVVINPGVDTQYFYPLEDVEKIPNSLLYVGRVDKRKGVDFLIKAMPHAVRQKPDIKLFVGGVGKHLTALKAFVRSNGIEKNVNFLGFIPDETLNLWYNKVQCVVIPSVFEGFGLTAVEAMAAGTSVICTEVDSLKHIVIDGQSGFIVPYDDTATLGAKIVALLSDPHLQQRFSVKGRQRVQSLYNWDVVVGELAKELFDS